MKLEFWWNNVFSFPEFCFVQTHSIGREKLTAQNLSWNKSPHARSTWYGLTYCQFFWNFSFTLTGDNLSKKFLIHGFFPYKWLSTFDKDWGGWYILELLTTYNPIDKVRDISQHLRTHIRFGEECWTMHTRRIRFEYFRFGWFFVGLLCNTSYSKRISISS